MKTNRFIITALTLVAGTTVFGQVTKKVVIEEFTGTWCGACPVGAVMLEQLHDTEPNAITIAIHGPDTDSDPMAYSTYVDGLSHLPESGSYPSAHADRVVSGHAGEAVDFFNERKNEIPKAAVNVTGAIDGSNLKITVTANFQEAVSGDWRLAAVITENGVTGTTSGYDQVNYYHGEPAGTLTGAGHDWTTAPDPVPAADMVYDHVARALGGDNVNGVEGSLPTSIIEGAVESYTYTIAIDPAWDLSKIHVIGMLVDPSGKINNADEGSLGTVGLIDNQKTDFNISVYPNPTSDLVNIKLELETAATVSIAIVNLQGETVSIIETQPLSEGTNYNAISVSDLAPGIYFVQSTINAKINITKIIVE